MKKNKNKSKTKVNSIDSNTLDYYNEDMSKKAVGKLFQNVNASKKTFDMSGGVEGVRPISEDEYNTFQNNIKSSQVKTSNNTNVINDINNISNNSNRINSPVGANTENMRDFIKGNQRINTHKKIDTLHKNNIKEQLLKLSSNTDIDVNSISTNSNINTYVHENLPKQINEAINEQKTKTQPSIFIDDFSPSSKNVKKEPKKKLEKKIKRNNEEANINYKAPKIINNEFKNDDYFATLRTSRLNTQKIDLDYENLPYSTNRNSNISNANKKRSDRPKNTNHTNENIQRQSTEHISKYRETESINDNLINLVRQTTQEMEKEQIISKDIAYKRKMRNEERMRNENRQRNNNATQRRPHKHKKSNLAFIRITTTAVIILLAFALIYNINKVNNLKTDIYEKDLLLKEYESINNEMSQLRLENESLKEQLSVLNPVDNTEETEEDGSTSENDAENALPTEYVVQSGDNLQKISNKFYGNKEYYTKIKEENSLQSNDLYVGQVLIIPAL